MTQNLDAAFNDAQEAAAPFGSKLVGQVLERIGNITNAKAVFGDPVERDGITVIPVARVSWGGGAGGGRGADSTEGSFDGGEGAGGGGGARVTPVGYIEIRDGTAQFVPIRDLGAYIPLILVGTFAWWMFVRTLRSLFR